MFRLLLFAVFSLTLLGALFLLGWVWTFRPEAVTEYPAIKIQIPGIIIMLFAVSGVGLVFNIIWEKLRDKK